MTPLQAYDLGRRAALQGGRHAVPPAIRRNRTLRACFLQGYSDGLDDARRRPAA